MSASLTCPCYLLRKAQPSSKFGSTPKGALPALPFISLGQGVAAASIRVSRCVCVYMHACARLHVCQGEQDGINVLLAPGISG